MILFFISLSIVCALMALYFWIKSKMKQGILDSLEIASGKKITEMQAEVSVQNDEIIAQDVVIEKAKEALNAAKVKTAHTDTLTDIDDALAELDRLPR